MCESCPRTRRGGGASRPERHDARRHRRSDRAPNAPPSCPSCPRGASRPERHDARRHRRPTRASNAPLRFTLSSRDAGALRLAVDDRDQGVRRVRHRRARARRLARRAAADVVHDGLRLRQGASASSEGAIDAFDDREQSVTLKTAPRVAPRRLLPRGPRPPAAIVAVVSRGTPRASAASSRTSRTRHSSRRCSARPRYTCNDETKPSVTASPSRRCSARPRYTCNDETGRGR